MKTLVKGNKKFDTMAVVSIVSIFISLYFSFNFFSSISTIFGILIIIIALSKAMYINTLPKIKSNMLKLVIILICIASSIFDLIGTIANCYNQIEASNQSQFKMVANIKYKDYETKSNDLKLAIAKEAENLNKYQSLDSYKNGSPSWEDKTELTKTWQQGKDQIISSKQKYEKELLELNKNIPSKEIKIKTSNKGYNNILLEIEKITKIKSSHLILFLSIFFALIIEMIIYSSLLAKKYLRLDLDFKTESLDLDKNLRQDLEILDKNLRPSKNLRLNKSKKLVLNKSKKLKKSLDSLVLDQSRKSKILDFKTKSLDLDKNLRQSLDNNSLKYDEVKNYIVLNFKPKDKIKKFQNDFNLNLKDYRNIHSKLKENNIIYTENKNTYKS